MQEPKLFKSYEQSGIQGELYCGDAQRFLERLDANSADIVFLDPPFNLGKRYLEQDPNSDRRPAEEYAAWLTGILNEAIRVLAKGGALYMYHLPVWAMRFGPQLDQSLTFRHWIAVSMKNGFARGPSLYPAHYALLYFTKGKPAVFQRPKLAPMFCRHCGKTIKDYGGYKRIIAEKGEVLPIVKTEFRLV